MKRKYLWMGIFGLILAVGVTAVHARGHKGKFGGQHPGFGGHRLEALDLTQEQKDQIHELRSENRKAMIELKSQAELAKVELHDLMREKNPSESKVEKAVDKINAARGKMMQAQVKQKLAVKKLLTDEQIQKLEEMPKRRKGRGQGERQFRHRRGGRGMMGSGWENVAPQSDQI